MAALGDLLALAAGQDIGDVRGAEALADARHARQDLARDDDPVADRLELAEAVVARAALRLLEPLAEIRDEMPMAAADAGRVPLHVPEQRRRASVSSPLRSSITRHFRKSAPE